MSQQIETDGTDAAVDAVGGGMEKKAIGNFAGAGKIVSYSISKELSVTVTANTTGDGAWTFKGIKNGDLEIMGSIIGGKWKAVCFCKFIRNGIVSRANRLNHLHHRNKTDAAPADSMPISTEDRTYD